MLSDFVYIWTIYARCLKKMDDYLHLILFLILNICTIIHFPHFSGINDELIENHHRKEKLSTEDLIFRAVRSLLDTTTYKSDNSEGRQLGQVGGMIGEISSFFSFISYLILLITLIGGPGGITLVILWVLGFWSNMK